MTTQSAPPTHVVADLAFRAANEVRFVRCACGSEVTSLQAWTRHLSDAGQHPDPIRLGPPSPDAWRRGARRATMERES
jgi:hypothetical protein